MCVHMCSSRDSVNAAARLDDGLLVAMTFTDLSGIVVELCVFCAASFVGAWARQNVAAAAAAVAANAAALTMCTRLGHQPHVEQRNTTYKKHTYKDRHGTLSTYTFADVIHRTFVVPVVSVAYT